MGENTTPPIQYATKKDVLSLMQMAEISSPLYEYHSRKAHVSDYIQKKNKEAVCESKRDRFEL